MNKEENSTTIHHQLHSMIISTVLKIMFQFNLIKYKNKFKRRKISKKLLNI